MTSGTIDQVEDAGKRDTVGICLDHLETAETELWSVRSLLRSLVDSSQETQVQQFQDQDDTENASHLGLVGQGSPAIAQNGLNSAKHSAADTEEGSIVEVVRRYSKVQPPWVENDKGTQTDQLADTKMLRMCWEDFDFISREAKQGLIDQVMLASKKFHYPSPEDGVPGRSEHLRRNSSASFAGQVSLGSRIGIQTDGEPVALGDVQFVPIMSSYPWLKSPVIDPQAKFRIAWIFLGLAFICYECFSIPVLLCFETEPSGFTKVFGEIVTIYFLTDVLLSFFVGYLNAASEVILDPVSIVKKYLKTWFVPDMLASFPVEWLVDGETSSLRLMRFFRLLRLARLVRILKLKSIMNAVQSKMEGRPMFRFGSRLFKLFGGLVLAMHWCACIWYFVGNLDVDDKENSWVNNWLTPETPTIRRYVWSLYFSLTTMTTVGYGDITPKTYSEALFALFLLPVASVVFATFMGNLTDLVTNMNATASRQADQRMLLANYMNWREVPVQLRSRIRTYMIDLWDESRDWPAYEDTLKEDLSPVLLEELMMHIHSKVLTTAPFLLWMQGYPICIRQLSSKLTTTHLDAGDHLFLVGEACTIVYVLTSGTMWLSLNQTIYEDADDRVDKKPSSELHSDRYSTVSGAPIESPRMAITKSISGQMRQEHKDRASSGWKDLKTQVQRFGKSSAKVSPKPCVDVSQADALIESYAKMKVHDLRLKYIVIHIQRNWRSKKQRQMIRKARNDGLRSHMVYAPSYFGESCLWVPRWKWPDTAPKHMYNARCKKRADLVCIPRDAIDAILDRFSPWLPDRFEFFRKEVVDQLRDTSDESTPGHTSGYHGFLCEPAQNIKDFKTRTDVKVLKTSTNQISSAHPNLPNAIVVDKVVARTS